MRTLLVVTVAVLFVSALAGAGAALFMLSRPAWFLAGFEFVVLFAAGAAVAGWCWSSERPSALAIACYAGSIVLASGLGYLAVKGRLGDVSLKPLLAVRLGGAGLLGVAAVLAGLSGSRQAWRMFLTGLGISVPLAAGGLATLVFRDQVSKAVASLGGFGSFFFGVIALAVLGALGCIAAHLIIRAFEVGAARRAAG
jgi:hypothetical protein